MANHEHQANPVINPQPDWIEIDHASADVGYDTLVEPNVGEFFYSVTDCLDERNRWIIPKAGVKVLARVMMDDGEIHHLDTPEYGRNLRLVFEYAATRYDYDTVRIDEDSQLVLPLDIAK